MELTDVARVVCLVQSWVAISAPSTAPDLAGDTLV